MKRILLTLGVGCMVLLAAAPALAQNKIGYIDVNELISVMPSAKRADSSLNQYRLALVQVADEKQKELQDAIEKFVKDSATMTPAVKEAKRKVLQESIQANSGMDQKLNQQLEEKRQELIKPVQDEAFNAIRDVAKEKGYSFVLYKESIIVAPPGDDILEAVKKKLKIQ